MPDHRQKSGDRRYTGALNFLPDEVSNVLYERYHLSREVLHDRGVRWAPDEQRVYIPTPYFDKDGGGILRTLAKDVQPKVKSCRAPGSSGMGFYDAAGERFEFLLVVEDALSALCAAEYCYTVSLQGTYMSHERLLELVEYAAGDPIVFALDRDATDKAIAIVNKYKYLADVYVAALPKDIKDMTIQEREEFLWSIRF